MLIPCFHCGRLYCKVFQGAIYCPRCSQALIAQVVKYYHAQSLSRQGGRLWDDEGGKDHA